MPLGGKGLCNRYVVTSGSGAVVAGAVVTVSTGSRPSVGGYGVGGHHVEVRCVEVIVSGRVGGLL